MKLSLLVPRRLLVSLLLLSGNPLHAAVINADFGRDILTGTNPGANPAPVLYTGSGPAPDSGTVWNNVTIPLAATGDQGTDTIDNPLTFSNLTSATS